MAVKTGIYGLYKFYRRDGTSKFLSSTAESVYRAGTTNWEMIAGGLSSDTQVYFTRYNDWCIFVGGIWPEKYDATTSTSLGMGDSPNNYLPWRAKYVIATLDRLWFGNTTQNDGTVSPHYVQYSEVGTPTADGTGESWPAVNYLTTQNRMPVTGLGVLDRRPIIFDEDGVNVVYGTTQATFALKRYPPLGCAAARSIANTEGSLIFLSKRGIAAFSGGISKLIFPEKLENFIDRINMTYIEKCAGIYYKDEYWLSYPYDTATVNDRTLVVNLKTSDVTNLDKGYNCFAIWDGVGDSGELYGGSTSAGKVYKLDTTYADESSNISAYWQGKYFDLDRPELRKRFYRIFPWVYASGAGTLTITVDIDYGTQTDTLTATLASGTNRHEIDFHGVKEGRFIRFKFANDSQIDFHLLGFIVEFDYLPLGAEI